MRCLQGVCVRAVGDKGKRVRSASVGDEGPWNYRKRNVLCSSYYHNCSNYNMHTSTQRLLRGFTLVEIMIVVAIIALLAAIFSHNILRARKRAHAAKVLDDLRALDGALDQWALENNKS